MVYKWTVERVYKTDAQVAGEVCDRLTKTVGLTSQSLLDASRNKNAPLHDEFEWDDSVAGEKYRLEQAKCIIRNLSVTVEESQPTDIDTSVSISEPTGETTPVAVFTTNAVLPDRTRAFVKIPKSNGYEPMHEIMQDEEKKNSLMEIALRELNSFVRKYCSLNALEGVFREVEKLNEEAVNG